MIRVDGYLGIKKNDTYATVDCKVPDFFEPPPFVDSRGLCTPVENQNDKPYCVAYTLAGYVEARDWQKAHRYTQVDPAPRYKEAKRIDGDDNAGTYLSSIYQAGKLHGDFDHTANIEILRTLNDVKYALHSNLVCFLCFRITDGWYHPNKVTGFVSDGSNTIGGHCVLGCWYATGQGVGFQNSWGLDWGVNGFGRLTEKQFAEQFMEGMIVI